MVTGATGNTATGTAMPATGGITCGMNILARWRWVLLDGDSTALELGTGTAATAGTMRTRTTAATPAVHRWTTPSHWSWITARRWRRPRIFSRKARQRFLQE